MRQCKHDGCGKKHYARGYCRNHYARFMRGGIVGPDRMSTRGECVIDGCSNKRKSLGLCASHYRSFRAYGDPLVRKNRHSGEGTLCSTTGYMKTSINGKRKGDHVWAAEAMLGRELLPGEVVHHIDGDKLNNNHDNLMVFPDHKSHYEHHRQLRNNAVAIEDRYYKVKNPIQHAGVSLGLRAWSDFYGVNYSILKYHYKKGIPFRIALKRALHKSGAMRFTEPL